MRKILIWGLILCLSVSLVNVATAYDIAICGSETEMRAFYETHKNDEVVRDHFVWPSELEFLGRFYRFRVNLNGLYRLWFYTVDVMNEEGIHHYVDLVMAFTDRDWNEYASAVSGKDVEIQTIGINLTKESMVRLQENVVTESDQWFRIKRGELEYIYKSKWLDTIVWKHSGISFRLVLGDTKHYDMGYSALSALFSLEEEPFLEAQRQLLNIGNPNPVPPEPEKACGGVHVYGTQWDYDDNTHWYPCVCGAKSQQGFHADENQDGACDICAYDPNGETVSDPVEDPVQPTQPPTEPATQPTEPTQPTTGAPTAPPTQPNPAEPDAPSVGLWIGISAAALAAAAALLLLRKKK